ncbi:probable ATP-dependent RNA helicase pitchoune isoform X2 [Hyposmocoma kahamanoa]|uniref:probable ATP-dependent RNA helicase pitchoune isoform X2 n=1 Tax=Hyposmocoma kahamanoa TaxID=1477025 RepID=UPI000E6D697F|nr:probable ATP-dependent RNA helicase pitchoune isoform X2 [Hyposmocoma kahamanoa]
MDIKCSILTKPRFSMLEGKIDHRILEGIKDMGIEKPTRIQAETLPHLMLHKDLIGTAQTGSGKTLAFLIPTIDGLIRLKFTRKHGTGCIILSPTRELALQTYQVMKKLLSSIDLSHALIVGGEKKMKDIVALKKGANILVSTPGRLLDHLQSTAGFNCKNLQYLVVDEADKLLEAGFEKHVTGIINLLPKKRQTMLFSATIDEKVKNLIKLALTTDPVWISVKDDNQSTVTGLQQGYYICPINERIAWLYKMLRKCKKLKVMIFFSSCKSVDFHYEFFKCHCQANVLSIHGKQSQSRRKEAYHSFVEAQNGTLFCTDVAARGLDIPRVDWIVQYDPPTDPKEYIHRVGRTARGLNKTGNAVILLRPEEENFVNFLRKENIYLDKYSFGDLPHDVQAMLEGLIKRNGVMKTLARKAYLSFLRCYKSHPLKKIFNIKTLDLKLAAQAFGFLEQPHVDFLNCKTRT